MTTIDFPNMYRSTSACWNEQPLREEDEEERVIVAAATLEICSAPTVAAGRTASHRFLWPYLGLLAASPSSKLLTASLPPLVASL
jgi:hypothetical protein